MPAPRIYHRPAHEIVARLAAFQHIAGGFWRTDVLIRRIDATTTRLGVRRVPGAGLTYHLVLLRVQLEELDDQTTAIKGNFRIEPWVWFATLPLFILMLYSLVLMATGDLPIEGYTVAVNAGLGLYTVYMVGTIAQHIHQLRGMFYAAVAGE